MALLTEFQGQLSSLKVCVCGRLETVHLKHIGLNELSEAIQNKLELQPPFLFLDSDGRPLVDNVALETCAALGKQVVVKLTEGVLHDVSRRVDQLRHLQWGFILDQLSILKREQDRHQAEMISWKADLAHQATLEKNLGELRQRVDEVYALLLRDQHDEQASASVSSSALLVEMRSAQSTCESEIIELRREFDDCKNLLKEPAVLPTRQAVEEVLRVARDEQARLIDELKAHLFQRHDLLENEFRSLFVTKSEASKIADDLRLLREGFSRDVTLASTIHHGVGSERSPSRNDVSKVTVGNQHLASTLDEPGVVGSPQQLRRCFEFEHNANSQMSSIGSPT